MASIKSIKERAKTLTDASKKLWLDKVFELFVWVIARKLLVKITVKGLIWACVATGVNEATSYLLELEALLIS